MVNNIQYGLILSKNFAKKIEKEITKNYEILIKDISVGRGGRFNNHTKSITIEIKDKTKTFYKSCDAHTVDSFNALENYISISNYLKQTFLEVVDSNTENIKEYFDL